jgi:hypothetical protein
MPEDKDLTGTVEYYPDPGEKESAKSNIGRQAYRTTRNALIGLAAAPSNFAEGTLNLVNAGIELLPGVNESPLPKHLPLPTSEVIEKNIVEPLEEKFLPAGYGQSHNEIEDMWDTFEKDFVGFLGGGRVIKSLAKGVKALGAGAKALKGGAALAKGATNLSEAAKSLPFANSFMKVAKFLNPEKISVGKALTIASLGNLASYGSKYLGAGPNLQSGLKIGTMLTASLSGTNTLGNGIKEEFKDLNKIVPRGTNAVLSTRSMESKLNNLRNTELHQGLPESVIPAKGFLRKTINGVEKKIESPVKNIDINDAMAPLRTSPTGTQGFPVHPAFENPFENQKSVSKLFPINPAFKNAAVGAKKSTSSVEELWKVKKELNNIIYESNRHADATKIRYAEKVRDIVNETLKGPQARIKFPEFTNRLIEADKMTQGFKNVSDISNFLITHDVMKDLTNPMTRLVFYTNLSGPLHAAKAAVGISALKNIIAPIEMFARSPEIRNYYYKAMKAAYAKNAPVANRYIKKFDYEANKINPGDQEGPGVVL